MNSSTAAAVAWPSSSARLALALVRIADNYLVLTCLLVLASITGGADVRGCLA